MPRPHGKLSPKLLVRLEKLGYKIQTVQFLIRLFIITRASRLNSECNGDQLGTVPSQDEQINTVQEFPLYKVFGVEDAQEYPGCQYHHHFRSYV